MKRTQKASWFVAGMLCTAILVNTVAPAAAALVAKTIQVYTGIEVFVDDKKIDAGETHGNPDAFAYNGTTYVAVAAISKSLGEKVYWDGENKKVYIGDHDGASHYLLDVCPPYNMDDLAVDLHASVTMGGTNYNSALSTYDSAYFNLNGMYDTLTFTVGHIDDERSVENETYSIYLDGKLVLAIPLDPYALPKEYKVNLNGALHMEIHGSDYAINSKSANAFALAEMRVS